MAKYDCSEISNVEKFILPVFIISKDEVPACQTTTFDCINSHFQHFNTSISVLLFFITALKTHFEHSFKELQTNCSRHATSATFDIPTSILSKESDLLIMLKNTTNLCSKKTILCYHQWALLDFEKTNTNFNVFLKENYSLVNPLTTLPVISKPSFPLSDFSFLVGFARFLKQTMHVNCISYITYSRDFMLIDQFHMVFNQQNICIHDFLNFAQLAELKPEDIFVILKERMTKFSKVIFIYFPSFDDTVTLFANCIKEVLISNEELFSDKLFVVNRHDFHLNNTIQYLSIDYGFYNNSEVFQNGVIFLTKDRNVKPELVHKFQKCYKNLVKSLMFNQLIFRLIVSQIVTFLEFNEAFSLNISENEFCKEFSSISMNVYLHQNEEYKHLAIASLPILQHSFFNLVSADFDICNVTSFNVCNIDCFHPSDEITGFPLECQKSACCLAFKPEFCLDEAYSTNPACVDYCKDVELRISSNARRLPVLISSFIATVVFAISISIAIAFHNKSNSFVLITSFISILQATLDHCVYVHYSALVFTIFRLILAFLIFTKLLFFAINIIFLKSSKRSPLMENVQTICLPAFISLLNAFGLFLFKYFTNNSEVNITYSFLPIIEITLFLVVRKKKHFRSSSKYILVEAFLVFYFIILSSSFDEITEQFYVLEWLSIIENIHFFFSFIYPYLLNSVQFPEIVQFRKNI